MHVRGYVRVCLFVSVWVHVAYTEGVCSALAAGCAVGTKVMESLSSLRGLAPLSPGVISALPAGETWTGSAAISAGS